MITNSLSWIKDRRTARAEVVRHFQKMVQRAEEATRTEATDTSGVFESMAEFQAAALLAGIPREFVMIFSGIVLKMAQGGFADEKTAQVMYKAIYWFVAAMWHPVRTRVAFWNIWRLRYLKKLMREQDSAFDPSHGPAPAQGSG